MKVLLVNGSTHPQGGTWQDLSVVEEALHEKGIETEWFWIGNKSVRGCIDCRKCAETYRCAFSDDVCNKLIESILKSDGSMNLKLQEGLLALLHIDKRFAPALFDFNEP